MLTKGKFISERLKQAREASCLNMTELAEIVGVSRQAISQFESGKSTPNIDTIKKISHALNVELQFFSTGLTYTELSAESIPTYRSFKTSLAKSRLQAKAFLDLFAHTTDSILEHVNIIPPNLPEIDINDFNQLSNSDIEYAAEMTRRAFGIGDGPISNVTMLLENHGIFVGMAEFDKKVDGVSRWYAGRPFVLVSANVSSVRTRFNLAHELGHLVLHRDQLDESDMTDKESFNKIEKQADYFASCFLMPEKTFCSEIFSVNWDVLVEYKKRWRVSIQAMIMRLFNTGFIDEYKKVRLFQTVSKKRARRVEPLDNEIPVEFPCLYSTILDLYHKEGIQQPGDLAHKTNLTFEFLEMLTMAPKELIRPNNKINSNVVELKF